MSDPEIHVFIIFLGSILRRMAVIALHMIHDYAEKILQHITFHGIYWNFVTKNRSSEVSFCSVSIS